MITWAAAELQYADLGDARLNKRLVKIVEDLAAHPNASVTEATENWSDAKAIYRFWQNEQVRAVDIIEAQQMGVVERLKDYPVILAIQDTSDLSFSHHLSKRSEKGFGPISAHQFSLGLKVHSTLAVTSEGVPLGLLDQKTWAREPKQKGKNKQKKKRSLFEKESKRWFSSLVATELSIAIVAWRLLWLTYEARVNPELPCDRVLETYEWQALYAHIHKSVTVPSRPPCLRQAVRWIAQLGGFLGRKSDKEPGVKTIWRGMRRLHDISSTWKLLRSIDF